MIANKDNFYMGTIAKFISCEKPNRKPDYISASGSQYWYMNTAVIRFSDHWNMEINSCEWYLNNGNCGICEFKNFIHESKYITVYSSTPEKDFKEQEYEIDNKGNGYISFMTDFNNMKDGMVFYKDYSCVYTKWKMMSITLD